MNPGMYIFINEGLGMTPGKIAAQAGHAAVEAYRLTPPESNLMRLWYKGGHYAKYVMSARDTEHLLAIERYLNDRGFDTALIIDEGHTEIPAITPTALGVALVDRDNPHVQASFSSFDLMRPKKPKTLTEVSQPPSWLRTKLDNTVFCSSRRSEASTTKETPNVSSSGLGAGEARGAGTTSPDG